MRRIYLEETASTNTHLKDLCRKNPEHGLAVYSFNQMSGYGRQGKFWHGEQGKSIALSVALKCHGNADSAPFSIAAGVAVCKALSAMGLDVAIKWPNDILSGDKKLCGILCERIFVGDTDFYVVGIGINVNNTHFPGELAATATSMKLAQSAAFWDLEWVMEQVLAQVFCYYEMAGRDFLAIVDEFRQNCQNIGQDVVIFCENRCVSGYVMDIDHMGRLILQKSDGKIEKYAFGEVSLRNVSGEINASGN